MLDRIESESFRLGSPAFADELIGCEPSKGLQPAAEVVGCDEVSEMGFELGMVVVVEALDRRVLDRAVHPLDLTIGPWMAWFGQSMFNIEIGTGQLK